jgi:hypothetical protein
MHEGDSPADVSNSPDECQWCYSPQRSRYRHDGQSNIKIYLRIMLRIMRVLTQCADMERPGILIGIWVVAPSTWRVRAPSEAEAARAAFRAMATDLPRVLRDCTSGQQLVDRGYGEEVHLAVQLNVSDTVPILRQGAYQRLGRHGTALRRHVPPRGIALIRELEEMISRQ